MFVQVIRATLKPGAWEKVEELEHQWQTEQAPIAPGFKGSYLLRDKRSPNNAIWVVLFENAELAQQNSNRPETNQFAQEMMKLSEGEPEFIDTELVHSYLM